MTLKPVHAFVFAGCFAAMGYLAAGPGSYAKATAAVVPAPVPVAPQSPARVAVVNPLKVLFEMQEGRDLRARLQAELAASDDAARAMQRKLQDLVDARALLRPESEQYLKLSREIGRAKMELDNFRQFSASDFQLSERLQLRGLYGKIQSAAARVATERGYDILISEAPAELPKGMEDQTTKEFLTRVAQRNTLYVNPAFDLTPTLTATLDAEYRK